MSDAFDRLQAALKSAPPAPDADRRAANLRAAMENFDQLQETAAATRQTSERPGLGARFSNGVVAMFHTLTSRAALGATTGLVTVGLAVLLIAPLGTEVTSPPDVVKLKPEAQARTDDAQGLIDAEPILEHRLDTDMEMAMAEEEVVMAPAAPEAGLSAQTTLQAAAPQTRAKRAPIQLGQGAIGLAEAPVVRERIIAPDMPDTEAFANADPNPVKITREAPVSTFSIDVDTASYSVVRSSLMNGALPPKGAVRIEEMINYFPYAYPAPDADEAPFRTTVTTTATPWNAGTQLVHIGLQGALPQIADRPPLNLVFLIDTSGSMQDANKLPLLKQSFRLMLSELRPQDQVAIVTYARSAGQVLAPTPAGERATILAALDRLQAGGSTAGQAGLQQAYATAAAMAEEGEIARVILATDGDFNVGLSDPGALKDFIADKRDSGTYLSVLGFGRGNLDDATMQALAQNGNGQAAYIDTLSEARKVLVDQLTGALFPIANDVKIQVEFNPATVAEYRLLGYETRALRREDFNNDTVDAGEIGAGHTVTAIYEVTPVGSDAVLNDPLRYGTAPAVEGPADELGFLRLRYKTPGADNSQLIETPLPLAGGNASDDARFSIAIAGFGQLLSGSDYLGGWGYAEAIALANQTKGDDPFGYRAQAVTLMRLAESLSAQ